MPSALAMANMASTNFGLYEWLTSADGQAAILDEGFVFEHIGKGLFRRHGLALRLTLSVWIVAILAAQWTSVEEKHVAHSGTVDGAAGFDGVDEAFGNGDGQRSNVRMRIGRLVLRWLVLV